MLGEIGTLMTLISLGFYFVDSNSGIAYQACVMEARYPGMMKITAQNVRDGKGYREGTPFITNFPLAALCMPLAYVCFLQLFILF